MEKEKTSVMIIDSFALLFRGFFSMAAVGNYMRNSSGLCTNGLYQFTRYMLNAIDHFQPTHVICAFDMGAQTFRNDLYPDYKANRQPPPEELVPQFDQLWELVEAFDIPCIGVEGYEADDVIGTLAKSYSAQEKQVSILSGDGDLLQLIDDHISVHLMKKGFGNYETVHKHNLNELRGLAHPDQIIEMKALMGDSADNIPGCPKVGPKTALKLIEQFHDIDNLFAQIDQVKGKLQERLLEHRELIYLSRDLASIRTDLDLTCSLDQCIYQINPPRLIAKLEELEFRNLSKQFGSIA